LYFFFQVSARVARRRPQRLARRVTSAYPRVKG
jgi:hypothetical protein